MIGSIRFMVFDGITLSRLEGKSYMTQSRKSSPNEAGLNKRPIRCSGSMVRALERAHIAHSAPLVAFGIDCLNAEAGTMHNDAHLRARDGIGATGHDCPNFSAGHELVCNLNNIGFGGAGCPNIPIGINLAPADALNMAVLFNKSNCLNHINC